MSDKKPALGRGLADLLGQAKPRALAPPPVSRRRANHPAARALAVKSWPTSRWTCSQRGRYQPRIDMRQEALEELAISIRNQGVIQPIVVRPLAVAGRRPAAAL